jgi:hypothetical protein
MLMLMQILEWGWQILELAVWIGERLEARTKSKMEGQHGAAGRAGDRDQPHGAVAG